LLRFASPEFVKLSFIHLGLLKAEPLLNDSYSNVAIGQGRGRHHGRAMTTVGYIGSRT
jgi:hypothetical protein